VLVDPQPLDARFERRRRESQPPRGGRFTFSTGRPWTPPLMPESYEQNRWIYDPSAFNAGRLPSFHRLDIRVDRQWNQRERSVDTARQLGVLRVIGLNVKFRSRGHGHPRPPWGAALDKPRTGDVLNLSVN